MLALLATLIPAAPLPLPRAVAVHQGSPAYAALSSSEVEYAGRLQKTADGFRLMVLDGWGRGGNLVPLHAPGLAHRLNPFVGQHVRLTGKLDDGKLWPGTIERFGRDTPDANGIIARSAIPLQGATARKLRSSVARDPDQLAQEMLVVGPTAGTTASKVVAARLGREAIDWKKQMVVSVSFGLAPVSRNLSIVSTKKDGETLVVSYRLSTASGSGVHVAGETVLLPRHDGPVRFIDLAALEKPR